MLFPILIAVVVLQRLVELVMAKRNEKWMRNQGAFEVGASHYPFMILMHSAFFLSLILEVTAIGKSISPFWVPLLLGFLVAQIGRVWCLVSLGKFWNTKILILRGANVIRKGPYRLIRHPNYLIVSIELLLLPLIFEAYFTAIVYSILNVWMLSIRIPMEEQALKEATNYSKLFSID
ncbi:isoprenylcysteine carboxyl methyltransferase family protein [Sporosarcina sp. CAU 1771]